MIADLKQCSRNVEHEPHVWFDDTPRKWWCEGPALLDAVADDPVNHPTHYTSDPSGVECIQITRHRTFNVGNAIKYLWRAGLKDGGNGDPLAKQIEDLEKARWYIADEIARLKAAAS